MAVGTEDPPGTELRDVRRLQTYHGLQFPAWIGYRQLIVTGPPGSGKTSEITAIRGWPEEGYLDLARDRWWRSRELTFRPREIHLGFPFRGHVEGLSVFEKAWLDAAPPLDLQLTRIRMPGGKSRWSRLRSFAFEFLLPDAGELFAARQDRAYRQTHPVDLELSEEHVRRQLEIYRRVAHYLHRGGMIVFVRDRFGGTPKAFEDVPGSELPAWRTEAAETPASKKKGLLPRLLERLTGGGPVLGALERMQLSGTGTKVSFRQLPIEVTVGPQTLQVHLDLPTDPEDDSKVRRVIVFDPAAGAAGIAGFIRLGKGKRLRIGKGGRDRLITPQLPKEGSGQLDIVNEGDHLALVDLHSPTGTSVVGITDPALKDKPRADRLARLREITELFGGPIRMLEPDEAHESLREVTKALEQDVRRPADSLGRPGGLVELPDDTVPIVVGDLHANLDNLLRILIGNRVLDEMKLERACLVLLGDLVHVEDDQGWHEMDSSLLMTDFTLKLMQAFPRGVIHLRGNHDSFSPELTRDGVQQGRFWHKRARELRGDAYVESLQKFYDLLPYVVHSRDFVACHAGPPIESVTRDELINVRQHPRLMHQLTWNRLRSVTHPAGYTKREVKALRKSVGLEKSAVFIVSHNPRPDEETVWLDFGGVKRHHLVYSARRNKLALFTKIGKRMVPLIYKAEPLVDLANRLHSADDGK
ncbi:MAG: hypothetical protein GY716_22635 [bacterium]|nr:hypothetical protein [bacterium]